MSTAPSEPKKSRFARTPKDPNKPSRLAQVKTVYQTASKQNPALPWWMVLAFLVGFGLVMLLNFLWFHPIYFGILGVMFGALLALFVFGRLAERAMYGALDGQPGAAGAALGGLRRGWFVDQEPVAADAGRTRKMNDMSNASMVFRAVGKPGVVLIGEGPKGGATKLLESERKRVARVAGPEVPVHILRVGTGDDAIPASKITSTMNKFDKKLTDAEAAAVNKRLRALGSAKPPIPKGIDPRNARMDRKAVKGR